MLGLRVGTLSGCEPGAARGYRVSCSTHPTADGEGHPIFWDARFSISYFNNDFPLPAQGVFYPLDSPKACGCRWLWHPKLGNTRKGKKRPQILISSIKNP